MIFSQDRVAISSSGTDRDYYLLRELVEKGSNTEIKDMVGKTAAKVEKYKGSMRELSRHRDFRDRFRSIKKQEPEVTEQQLAELNLNTRGSDRAKAERLFRAIIKNDRRSGSAMVSGDQRSTGGSRPRGGRAGNGAE